MSKPFDTTLKDLLNVFAVDWADWLGPRIGLTAKIEVEPLDVDLSTVAARTDRFTGADLEDVVRRAGLNALRRSLKAAEVSMVDFEEALKDSRASVTPELEREYESMKARLKQDATSLQPIGFVSPGQLRARERDG